MCPLAPACTHSCPYCHLQPCMLMLVHSWEVVGKIEGGWCVKHGSESFTQRLGPVGTTVHKGTRRCKGMREHKGVSRLKGATIFRGSDGQCHSQQQCLTLTIARKRWVGGSIAHLGMVKTLGQ